MNNSFEYQNSNRSGFSFRAKLGENSGRIHPENRLNLKMNSKNKYFLHNNESNNEGSKFNNFQERSFNKKTHRQTSISQ